MLRPVDSLIYFYYNCSKCGERGSEVRLQEVQRPSPTHVCPCCYHIDELMPVDHIEVKHKGKKSVPEPTGKTYFSEYITHPDFMNSIDMMVKVGFGKTEAKKWLHRALIQHDPKTQPDLFKAAVLEHDNYEQSIKDLETEHAG